MVDDRECIIVTEIPYQVNKAEMIRKTAELVNDKKLKVSAISGMSLTETECVLFML